MRWARKFGQVARLEFCSRIGAERRAGHETEPQEAQPCIQGQRCLACCTRFGLPEQRLHKSLRFLSIGR